MARKSSFSPNVAPDDSLLALIWETPNIALCITDEQGNFVKVNSAYLQLYGWSEAELLGQHFTKVLPADQRESARQMHDAFILGAPESSGEWQVQCKSGEIRSVYVTAARLHQDKRTFKVTTVLDITERKQIESALHQSESKFEKLVANVPGTIYQFQLCPDGSVCFPYVSLGVTDIYELEVQSVLQDATALLNLTHPEDKANLEKAIALSAQTLQPWHWEGRLITPSGKLKWVQGASRPELQADGSILWDGLLIDITDRKHAEAQRQESQAFLNSVIENIPHLIFVKDAAELRFVRLNKVGEELLGYPQEALIGKTDYDLFPVEQAEFFTRKDRETLAQKQLVEITEEPIKTPQGDRFLQTRKIPICDQTGESQYLLGISVDITERKQMERVLRESEERYRLIAENSTDMIARYTPVGICWYASPACRSLLGYEPEELVGRLVYDLLHPDDIPQVRQTHADVLEESNISTLSYRIRRKDGQYIWFETTSHSIRHPQTQVIQEIISVSRDITERKQAEVAIQQSHQRTIRILESITDAFFSLDGDWRFTYINPQAERILLKSRAELLGQCIWEQFPEAVNSPFYHQYRYAAEHQVTVHFEEYYPTLGIWIEVRAYPLDEGISVYFRDSTARKQAEAELLERSRLSTLAAEIGAILGLGGNLSAILHRCTDTLVAHLEAVGVKIWTFNPETHLAELQVCVGELAEDCPFVGSSTLVASPFPAYPLIVDERLIGVMGILGRDRFTDAVHNTLSWVANAIAVAIDRWWAREELLSRREGLLFRLASQIRNSLDLNTILGTAVQEIRSLLNIDRCHFLWCWPHSHPPSLTITHESNRPELPCWLGDYSIPNLNPMIQKIQNLETWQIDDLNVIQDSKLASLQATLLEQGITSQLLLPLETRSGQLGAIVCIQFNGARPWSDREVNLLRAVTDQLTIAIEQAELYTLTRTDALRAQAQAKELEQALHKLQQTQAQLVQTEKMSSLGQMVAGVAHEINNPINFINGNLLHASNYIEDLLRLLELYEKHYPVPAPEVQEEAEAIDLDFISEDLPNLLESMRLGAERISQIVLSLRNFSRLDEAEKKQVNINEGLDNTLMILQHRIKPSHDFSGINVIKNYTKLPTIECYAGQLNQVFMNILANALDALEEASHQGYFSTGQPEHCPTIQISTQLLSNYPNPDVETPLDTVVIRIIDNGIGIPEATQKRLFDPFFTTKSVGKGTGLGLSISYQVVVEKHGGSLECFSEAGKGAEFLIRIPLVPQLSPKTSLLKSSF